MAIEIYHPGDFVPDQGGNGRHYPIPLEREPDLSEICYDKKIQPVSYIQANMVAVFDQWFRSFFESDYFKFVRIKTQSPIKEFKSFMRDIYKKDKPFLVIDPRPTEIVEDSLFAVNMLNRYNMVDPDHDNIGAKLVYSLGVLETDKLELRFRRNQYKIEFDVMIMEESLNRQTDTYNKMVMDIRHKSMFMLPRKIPVVIPNHHIRNVANFHGMQWDSEEFLRFLNAVSRYPILRRMMPNNQLMYMMEQDINIRVESPGFPARDNPEMSEAIEMGARIVDSFVFSAILPSEFIFLTKKEHVGLFDRGIEDEPDAITYISPIYADPIWPKELGGYVLTNTLDIEVVDAADNKLQILGMIKDYDPDIHSTIMEWVAHKFDLKELVMVRAYPNGSQKECGAILHDDGVFELVAPEVNKLYAVNIYVNLQHINAIRRGENMKFIGDVEKY
ncbi:MAG: hypothetical protein NC489_28675 [Ruminococcus flavefaciens]|nr:hypothetical protein [Ruminococcus flavefaciens]